MKVGWYEEVRWAASKMWRRKKSLVEKKKRMESKIGKIDSNYSLQPNDDGNPQNNLMKALDRVKRLPLNADSLNSAYDFVIAECSKSKLLQRRFEFQK